MMIKIQDIIPFMKDGWVAMDKNWEKSLTKVGGNGIKS